MSLFHLANAAKVISVTEVSSGLVERLMVLRQPLIAHRDQILANPFFFFRKSLQKKLSEIDSKLDQLDFELYKTNDIEILLRVKELIVEIRNEMIEQRKKH